MFKRNAFDEDTFPKLNYDNKFLEKRENITKSKCDEMENKVKGQKNIYLEKQTKIKLSVKNDNKNKLNIEGVRL